MLRGVVENGHFLRADDDEALFLDGWSQLTKMWPVTPLRNFRRLSVTSTTPGVR